MKDTASRELLGELFEEYSEWYMSLAEDCGSLPRSISGISENLRQFIYLLDDVELHHMIRNKFLRFVLDDFAAAAYAYGSLDIRGDSDEGRLEEVLDVIAADKEHYIAGSWRVIRDEEGRVTGLVHLGIRKGDDHEKQAGAWFLSGSIRFTDAENARYRSLWENAKPGVVFKDRNARQ